MSKVESLRTWRESPAGANENNETQSEGVTERHLPASQC